MIFFKKIIIVSLTTIFMLSALQLVFAANIGLPISIICYSGNINSQNDADSAADKLYKVISDSGIQIQLDKIYIEYPDKTEYITTFMNNLKRYNKNSELVLIGESVSKYQRPDIGIDLAKIEKLIDSGKINPKNTLQIKSFLKTNAPQVINDINNFNKINNACTSAKLTNILFDIEPGSGNPSEFGSSIKGLYYLLYYIRQYMNAIGMKQYGIETTLTWNQVQPDKASSTFINNIFGNKLQKPEIIANLLSQKNIAVNIFAMLYRNPKQLQSNNYNIMGTTWWKTYVAPALDDLPAINNGDMTITPAVGINTGDPASSITHSDWINFLEVYRNSVSDIYAKYGGKISRSVLGINGFEGFCNKITEEKL